MPTATISVTTVIPTEIQAITLKNGCRALCQRGFEGSRSSASNSEKLITLPL